MIELPEHALSLSQPWAFAVLTCGKDIENRRWPTRYRGPITLHAALSWDEEGLCWLEDLGLTVPEDLPRGAYVGTATITHCWRFSDRELDRSRRYLWAFGPYCFDLADVRALATPIPAKGRLGIYRRPELARPTLVLPLEEEPPRPASNREV